LAVVIKVFAYCKLLKGQINISYHILAQNETVLFFVQAMEILTGVG